MDTILMNLMHLNLQTMMRNPKRGQSQMNSVMKPQIAFMLRKDLPALMIPARGLLNTETLTLA